MDYQDFRTDYDRVLATSDQVPLPELAASIERLRGLTQTLTDPDERRSAGNDVARSAGSRTLRIPPRRARSST